MATAASTSGPPATTRRLVRRRIQTSSSVEITSLAGTHPEGVTLNSPGSRSAPWGTNGQMSLFVYPAGVAQASGGRFVQPLRGRPPSPSPSLPGCAARPWAFECDPFGVECWQVPGFQQSNLRQEWGEQKSTGCLSASRLLGRVLDCVSALGKQPDHGPVEG